MVRTVEKICGYQVSWVFAQLVLREDSCDGVNTLRRNEREQRATDYFEYAINTFADDAKSEEDMNDLREPADLLS